MTKKNKIILTLAIIGLIVTLTIAGTSYAYLRKTNTQTDNNLVSTLSCLNVTITGTSSPILMEKAFPLSDANGLATTPYSFKVTNNCNARVYALLNIENLPVEAPASQLSFSYLKYSLDGSAAALITSRGTATAVTSGATSRNLLKFYLWPNEERTFNLKIWVSQDATTEQVLGKTFEGKVVVVASATTNTCLAKPSVLADAESGSLLKALSADKYCLGPRPITSPGVTATGEDESSMLATPDDYGTSYIFRGFNENNYVKFANMCWRIVRVTGDDGTNGDYNSAIKLILFNDNLGQGANPCNQSGGTLSFGKNVGTSYESAINTTSNSNAYVGFMYGTAGSDNAADEHENAHDSKILKYLKRWYDIYIRDYENYLADVIWCGDKNIVTTTSFNPVGTSVPNTGLGYGTNKSYYATTKRFNPVSSASPSLVCSGTSTLGKYTASSDKGNAKLRGVDGVGDALYKVGLITADEAAWVGYRAGGTTQLTYLYKNSTGRNWWTMSPAMFESGAAKEYVVLNNGQFTNSYSVTTTYAVRPMIALKSFVKVSGSGTPTDPYVVKTDVDFNETNHNLPNEYQEVKYIQGKGAQYIDTGVQLFNYAEHEIVMDISAITYFNYSTIWGSTYDANTFEAWFTSGRAFEARYNNVKYAAANTIADNGKISIDLKREGTTLTKIVNGSTIGTATASNKLTTARFLLFLSGTDYGKYRLYTCKLYANGNLVADYVPCYRKSDGVTGLYDLVSNSFLPNSGTGQFFTGPIV